MLTLSKVTSEIRFLFKWGGITIVSLLLILILTKVGTTLKERIYPTPPPPPTVAFGKLSPITFPINATDKTLIYSLDTITGILPTFPDRIKVYKMIPNKINFLSLDIAQNKVSQIGFDKDVTLVAENTYQWVDKSPTQRRITFNILSSDFTFSSSFLLDPLTQFSLNPPPKDIAISTAQAFLSDMSSFPSDIDLAKTKTSFFSIINNALTLATSISNTQIIRVDFFQSSIDKLPIYYPDALTSSINLLVAERQNKAEVVEANFYHQAVSGEFATYPIKTANQAFLELKEGKAYVASFGTDTNVSIRNVFLGFYIGKEKQKFLLPIVIFEGDHGFFAYVLAITDEWINK